MARKKRTKSQLLQLITQYGIHIWVILILANAAIVYTLHFATHAEKKTDQTVNILQNDQASPIPSDVVSVSPSASPEETAQPITPVGPVLNLTFTVPGIGSGGGTLAPLHPKRNVTVYLYARDVNSVDSSVKPLYTIKGTATFDDNKVSPTYTSFLNPQFDLGSSIKEGDYQIVFRTDQSLRTVIKENPDDIGGKIFYIGKSGETKLDPQTVLMGDTIPDDGDNRIDISDYNAFINCYGEKNNSSFCQGKNYGDFDDNGTIDGIDYNILLRSLNVLAQSGQPIPQISPTVTSPKRVTKLSGSGTPTNKVTPTTAQAKTPLKSSSGAGATLAGFLLLFFFLLLGGVGFVLYKKNATVRNLIRSIIHLSPTGQPATPPAEGEEATPEQAAQTAEASPAQQNEETVPQPQAQQTPPQKTPETEQPAQQPAQETPPPAAQPETPPEPAQTTGQPAPAAPAKPAAGQTIEKDCYVRKKGPDEAGTGQWLLLTDDNGPLEAHYVKNDATDGFAKVKGVMKTENGKTFLEISEIIAEG